MTWQPPITDQLMTFRGILWHINGTNLSLTGPLVFAVRVHACVRVWVRACVCFTSWSHYHWKPVGTCVVFCYQSDNKLCVCLLSFFLCISRPLIMNVLFHLFACLKPWCWDEWGATSLWWTLSASVMSCRSFLCACARVCVCVLAYSLIRALTTLSDFCTSSSH